MLWPFIAALISGVGVFAVARKRKKTTAIPSLPTLRVQPPPHILSALQAASSRYGVPLEILVGVAHTESRFNPRAISSVGAKGLMQLMPEVIRKYGITDPFDPLQNAMGGARFLSTYYKKYGDWAKTLAAYNWGPGNVNLNPRAEQWPPQTQTYVARVQRAVV